MKLSRKSLAAVLMAASVGVLTPAVLTPAVASASDCPVGDPVCNEEGTAAETDPNAESAVDVPFVVNATGGVDVDATMRALEAAAPVPADPAAAAAREQTLRNLHAVLSDPTIQAQLEPGVTAAAGAGGCLLSARRTWARTRYYYVIPTFTNFVQSGIFSCPSQTLGCTITGYVVAGIPAPLIGAGTGLWGGTHGCYAAATSITGPRPTPGGFVAGAVSRRGAHLFAPRAFLIT